MENRTHTAASPASLAWCASNGRLAGDGSPERRSATIALWIAASGGRERRRSEVADLLVLEAVVGG
jgi:hypothetical protein